jgi:hypothetical protein
MGLPLVYPPKVNQVTRARVAEVVLGFRGRISVSPTTEDLRPYKHSQEEPHQVASDKH